MTETINQPFPQAYALIDEATKASGFTMASDALTCSLLKTLAQSKPGGKFLELGTGTGLSTSWILDGMDSSSALISVDNDQACYNIAKSFLGETINVLLLFAVMAVSGSNSTNTNNTITSSPTPGTANT